MATNAAPLRLRNGDWGARLTSDGQIVISSGDKVTIQTKGGKKWPALVAQVLWRGDNRFGSEANAVIISLERASKGSGIPRARNMHRCVTNSIVYGLSADCGTCVQRAIPEPGYREVRPEQYGLPTS